MLGAYLVREFPVDLLVGMIVLEMAFFLDALRLLVPIKGSAPQAYEMAAKLTR